MKVVEIQDIPDSDDANDAAHGNCFYLQDGENKIPLYLDNDRMIVWIGETVASDHSKLKALKFMASFGYRLEGV
jgi:hypothetical protein